MNERTQRIVDLSDGRRTSIEIAALVGVSPRYTRRVMQKMGLPRLGSGARRGEKNHAFLTGRRVDLNGYVLVTAPVGHPTARSVKGRNAGVIYEHRLVMERVLGRSLLPGEVPDHIDGLTLHNEPGNLRLFASNAKRLSETLRGQRPQWSAEGLASMRANRRGEDPIRIDMYRQRKERGEIRLRQILLAALSLGIDSPYLLGTHHHLQKAGIDHSSRSNLERALADLYERWGWDRTL